MFQKVDFHVELIVLPLVLVMQYRVNLVISRWRLQDDDVRSRAKIMRVPFS